MGPKIISNYCIQLSYDVKNYVDRLGGSLISSARRLLGGSLCTDRLYTGYPNSEVCIILQIILKPNPIVVFYFIQNISYFKTYLQRSMLSSRFHLSAPWQTQVVSGC